MADYGGFAAGLAQGFAATWRPDLVEKVRQDTLNRKDAQTKAQNALIQERNKTEQKIGTMSTEAKVQIQELNRKRLEEIKKGNDDIANTYAKQIKTISSGFSSQVGIVNQQLGTQFSDGGISEESNVPIVKKINKFGKDFILEDGMASGIEKLDDVMFKRLPNGNLGVRAIDEKGNPTESIVSELQPIREEIDLNSFKVEYNQYQEYQKSGGKESFIRWKKRQGTIEESNVGAEGSGNGINQKTLNKLKLKMAGYKNQLNSAVEVGDEATAEQMRNNIKYVENEILTESGVGIEIPQEKSATPLDIVNNPRASSKAINYAVNKMVGEDEEKFESEFIKMPFETQAKMLDSGNQFAADAYIKTASSGLSDILDKGFRLDENGHKIYPSQQLNRQLKEIQSMDMNKETKKILTERLIDAFETLSKAQKRDVDSKWFSGSVVENIFRDNATFEDQDERNFSIQKLIEDKADYGKEYLGGIELDSSLSPFASIDRFNESTMPVMQLAYRKMNGRELTPEAWKRITEEGWSRDKFNPDIVGQSGSVVKDSELDKLLRMIFKSKK